MKTNELLTVDATRLLDRLTSIESRLAKLEEDRTNDENPSSPDSPQPSPDPIPSPGDDSDPSEPPLLSPPVRDVPDFPKLSRTVRVPAGPLAEVAKAIDEAKPGTRIVLAGVYTSSGNLRCRPRGTAKDPITLEADGPVLVHSPSWYVGEHGSQLIVEGDHFWIKGIQWGKSGGRHLTFQKGSHGYVYDCQFTESWRHSLQYIHWNTIWMVGNHWHDNIRYNENHKRGVWPFTCGGWHLRSGIWNSDAHWVGNKFENNHGENIHVSFTDGFEVRSNISRHAINALIYLHTATNGAVLENDCVSTRDFRNHVGNNPKAALRISQEIQNFGTATMRPCENVLIKGNRLGGAVQHAVWFKPRDSGPWSSYGNLRIEGNTLEPVETGVPIRFEKADAPITAMNFSDVPIDSPDRDMWIIQ